MNAWQTHRAPLWLLLLITFAQSFTTAAVEFGLAFYASERYNFADFENLMLSLSFGVPYVLGAMTCHKLTERFGNRRMLCVYLTGISLALIAFALQPGDHLPENMRLPVLAGINLLLAFCDGGKWPIIESYVSAGRPPKQASYAVGAFNLTWSPAVVLAVAISGKMIAWQPVSLFLIPLLINILAMSVLFKLPTRPTHMPDDHPDRPDPLLLENYKALLAAARWSMIVSYSMLFMLNPLFPRLFDELGFKVDQATLLASPIHLLRFLTCAWMGAFLGWHGKRLGLHFCLWSMPLGSALILLSPALPGVLLGEIIFGLATGYCYYASLYYAMVTKNAAVDAGGAHESLIGLGFVLGPLLGLLGDSFSQHTHNTHYLIAASPLLLIALIFGTRALIRVKPLP